MFYSQIILAKKGPLGQVWQAAHWGARKLGRPAVFSTDIAAITTSIANPSVPMALRVSGHLLLGIVRIYSRQVQFLLDDCHQAMIKVKMAYSSGSTTNGVESGGPMIDITVTTRGTGGNNNAAANANKGGVSGSGSSNNNALNISNFGEYNDSGKGINEMDDYYNSNTTTTHFAIPLEELLQRASDVSGLEHTDDDWVPAELDDSTLHISTNLMNASGGMVDNTLQQSQLHNSNAAEEDWGVFDPNDGEGTDEEEEKDDEAKKTDKLEDDGSATHYSDIELTRAVNDSTTSDQIRRASILPTNESGIASNVSDKGGDSVVDTTDFPMNLDDDDQQNIMMNSDDDDDSELVRRRRNRHSLRLSENDDDANNTGTANEIGISFDASTEDDKDNNARNMATETTIDTKRRPRKRRKIITDDGRTELSSNHIRDMIADTSDICRSNDLFHPATWIDTNNNNGANNVLRNTDNDMLYDFSDMDQQRNRNLALLWNAYVPQERIFCRPAFGDDGHCSSVLLNLWSRNCTPVLNQPFRYDLVDVETTLKDDIIDQEAEEDDVEQARENRDDSGELLVADQPVDDIVGGNDPSFEEIDDGNNNAIPFEDEDDRMPMPDDDQENIMALESPAARSQNSMESIFSLGATNEMDNSNVGGVDFDGTTADDENDYDANMTTTSKWHKNTVKVFEVLKKNLISPDGENDNDDGGIPSNKKEFVSYSTLSDGVSRRTAAGFFFELLQLKTLNYIELNQDESYGDITISAGVKFTENPPLN